MEPAEEILDEQSRRRLLLHAREAIAKALQRQLQAAEISEPVGEDPQLSSTRGAFVTLWKGGELRGCVGFPDPDRPLYEVVANAAVAAALDDPRFQRLTIDEVGDIRIEISILSRPEPLEDVNSIRIGTDGLMLRSGFHSGLLLPQVAVQWGWDGDEFLSQTALKAGLPIDGWKQGAEIFRFSAQVFGEESVQKSLPKR